MQLYLMNWQYFGYQVYLRFVELLSAPVHHENMLWIVIPMVTATILMTLYFGKHPEEELGWNTAFGNSMIFIFVALDIFRFLYNTTTPPSMWNLVSNTTYIGITFALLILGITLLVVNYYHFLPEKLDFILCSGPPVQVLSYTFMTIVYAGVASDMFTFLAALFLLITLMGALRVLQLIQRIVNHNVVPHIRGKKEEKIEGLDAPQHQDEE